MASAAFTKGHALIGIEEVTQNGGATSWAQLVFALACAAAMLLTLAGLAVWVGYGERWSRAGVGRMRWLPGVLALAALCSAGVMSMLTPDALGRLLTGIDEVPTMATLLPRALVVMLGLAGMLALSAGLVDRVTDGQGSGRLRLLGPAVVMLALAWGASWLWPWRGPELLRDRLVMVMAYALALLTLIGAGAVTWSAALGARRASRVLASAGACVVTAALGFVAFALFGVITRNLGEPTATREVIAQLGFGGPGGVQVRMIAVLVFVAGTLGLGLGLLAGLRMGPEPMAFVGARRRPAADASLRDEEFEEDEDEPHVEQAAARELSAQRFPSRLHYLVLLLALCIVVFYASLVPVRFLPIRGHGPGTMEQVRAGLTEFEKLLAKTSYLPTAVDRRADWVANLVLFVPLGFLALAAVDADRRRRWALLVLGPVMAAAMAALIVGIEFTQVWCRWNNGTQGRTVSRNDMVAEAIGTAVGALIWLAVGQRVTRWARGLVGHAHGPLGRRRLTQAYAVAILLYSLFPLDFTIRLSELARKYNEGRIILMPFTLRGSALEMLLHFVKDVLMFVPIGVMVRRGWDWRGRPREVGSAMVMTTVLAGVLELTHLLVYQATFDVTQWIALALGGVLGVYIAGAMLDDRGAVRLGRELEPASRRAAGWGLCVAYAVPVLILMWWPLQIDPRREAIWERMGLLLEPPFRLYYFSGEWTALFKVTYCALLLVPVGAALRWAMDDEGSRQLRRRGLELWGGRSLIAALAVTLALGAVIEVGQSAIVKRKNTYTPEQVVQTRMTLGQSIDVTDPKLSKGEQLLEGRFPDMTDLMAYLAGAWMGWVAMGVFLPVGGGRVREEEEDPGPSRTRGRTWGARG